MRLVTQATAKISPCVISLAVPTAHHPGFYPTSEKLDTWAALRQIRIRGESRQTSVKRLRSEYKGRVKGSTDADVPENVAKTASTAGIVGNETRTPIIPSLDLTRVALVRRVQAVKTSRVLPVKLR